MIVLVPGLMLISVAILFALAIVGGRNLKTAADETLPALDMPTTIIVPITGSDPGMAMRLDALTDQEYGDYEVIFVTVSDQDDAAPIVDAVVSKRARNGQPCSHLHSGQATTSSQKNHSLLAGIAAARDDSEIFVFCDASHEMGRDWLSSLVSPIAAGATKVTTGYHHIRPDGLALMSRVRAVFVLHMYFLQGIEGLTQPWGANMAITRSLFNELRVAYRWSRSIVDDVCLASLLNENGYKAQPVAAACIETRLYGETLGSLCAWFTRQLKYHKFCFPFSWMLGGVAWYAFSALVLFAVFHCALWVLGGALVLSVGWSSTFVLLLLIYGLTVRSYHPRPGPSWLWLVAICVCLPIGAWCHLSTLFSNVLLWRGIKYRVTWGGEVIDVIR